MREFSTENKAALPSAIWTFSEDTALWSVKWDWSENALYIFNVLVPLVQNQVSIDVVLVFNGA